MRDDDVRKTFSEKTEHFILLSGTIQLTNARLHSIPGSVTHSNGSTNAQLHS